MKVTRREFLKGLVTSAAVVILPKVKWESPEEAPPQVIEADTDPTLKFVVGHHNDCGNGWHYIEFVVPDTNEFGWVWVCDMVDKEPIITDVHVWDGVLTAKDLPDIFGKHVMADTLLTPPRI